MRKVELSKNLGDLFKSTVAKYPRKKSFLFKTGGAYHSHTWHDFSDKTYSLAAYLLAKGLRSGDRVAILSENRPEWAMVDIACQIIGVATVPIYTSLSSIEIAYIMKDCGASVLAVSQKQLLEKIIPIQTGLPDLKLTIGFDASTTMLKDGLRIPFGLIKEALETAFSEKTINECIQSVPVDALATIIYTSGTTGEPKGVMLSHRNLMYNAASVMEAFNIRDNDIYLSFLPLSHVFERMAGYYLMIMAGATIAYAESMDTVPQNLAEIRPTLIFGVPRFYEKTRQRVLDAVQKASSSRKGLFFWAKALGEIKRTGGKRGALFVLESAIANVLVYKKFRTRLGGRVRFCVSGGAPLAKDVGEFFADLGVTILEGYGLSETSPVITVNREKKNRYGTVGVPLPGIEVRIADDGEIITKSPCVMQGYFGKPNETKEAIKDGWFYTGDLGSIDKDGFLAITGRKKELIVTSGGKKIAPKAIEEKMEKDPYILRCVLFGEGKKCISALIVPQREPLIEYARQQKMAFHNYAELLTTPKVYEFIEGRIEALSGELANYEKIKFFALLENDFTQEAGELTPTLKIKRNVVFSRYKDLLLPLYEKDIAH